MVQVYWLGAVWLRTASPVPGEAERSLISESISVMASYCLVVVEARQALGLVTSGR